MKGEEPQPEMKTALLETVAAEITLARAIADQPAREEHGYLVGLYHHVEGTFDNTPSPFAYEMRPEYNGV